MILLPPAAEWQWSVDLVALLFREASQAFLEAVEDLARALGRAGGVVES